MQVMINGKPESRPDGLSVRELLAELNLDGKPCAVEINRTVVPKAQHGEHRLQDGDRIEIVTLVGGG